MDLIKIIGDDLKIPRSRDESDAFYAWRVILAATSDWLQTAVFANDGRPSVEHVKKTALRKLSLYRSVYDHTDTLEEADAVEYIYETLLQNGAFLHTSMHVWPAPHRLIGYGGVSIVRGMMPEEIVCFSGLAPFVETVTEGDRFSFWETFALPQLVGDAALSMAWLSSAPTDRNVRMAEYLNVNRTSGSYYTSQPCEVSGITLARTPNPSGVYEYYLIKNGSIRRLQDDLIKASFHEYCALAIMNTHKRQTVQAEMKPGCVSLDFSWRLPGPDLRFIRYIAWPERPDGLHEPWRFSLHTALWPALRDRLNYLNYVVEEMA